MQAECRGREQLTRLRSGQPPLPGAAGAGRGGGGAPGAAGAGHPAQPLPRSPPFISPRLAPARSPGLSTASSRAPPPPPPSRGDRRSVRALLTLRSACVLHGSQETFRPGLAGRVPAAPHRLRRVQTARGSGTWRLRLCAQGPGPRPAIPGFPTSYLRDLGLHTQCVFTSGCSPGKWRKCSPPRAVC